jgi:hypothetical protein
MTDNLYAEYGNAGHRFPRTTKEAFGRDECLFVHNEIADDDDDITGFAWYFSICVYTLAVVVIGFIVLSQP